MRKLYVVGLVTIAFLLLPTVYASGDFTIVASPTILTIAAGNFGSSTITVTGSNGFSGTVLLSSSVSPNNPTITTSLNPTSVSISPAHSGQSILTVVTSPFTPLGTYTVTVTGTSGSISHPTMLQVTVTSATVGGVVVGSQSTFPVTLGIVLITIGGTAAIFVAFNGIRTLPNRRGHP